MQRRAFASLLLAAPAWAAIPAQGVPPEVLAEIGGAAEQGRGELRYLGFDIYEARLFRGAQPVAANWAAVPLALQIAYRRSFGGARIAERTLAEMRRQATVSEATGNRWLGAMKTLFPDVKPGDRMVGVQRPGEGVRFLFNGSLVGEVRDKDFARLFFGIWLADTSPEPALRSALLGTAP